MAAPVDAPEQAFRLRRFSGVNTFVDPVFLGPQLLALSQNWIPNQTYRLAKKPGSRLYTHTGYGITNITAVSRFYLKGLRYLYWYGQRPTASGSDYLFRTVEDTAVEPITGFTEDEAVGRMIRYGDYIYVGNGVDDIQQVPIEWNATTNPAVPLAPITTLTPAGTLVAVPTAASTDPALDSGSYEWAWAVYNTVTRLYVSRTSTDPASGYLPLKVEANQKATATAPSGALAANQVYRLFVAPNGWPIEYATQQGVDQTAASATQTFTSFDVTQNRVPVEQNVRRTGNIFTTFKGRVVFAGNRDDPNAVCATGVLLPGLEQDAFNQGAFFPSWARLPLPGRVTGIAVSGSTGPQDPRSPLVAFTSTKTFLYTGDPFDPEDATSAQVQLSDRIGCTAHDTIVPTPIGIVWMGMDSVYALGGDGGPPMDIGWPIADQIRAISAPNRGGCCAIYHKYFYKLAIPIPGGGPNVVQWWLDLRQGIGDTPSWWGPHVGPEVSAFATALEDPDEEDKGFAAQADTDVIFLHHQQNLYFDMGFPIQSVLRSGVFDAEQPFLPKVFTRLRAIARAASHSSIQVKLFTDGGISWDIDDIDIDGPAGAYWGSQTLPPAKRPDPATRAHWSVARWLHLGPLEVQTITPVERPRGLSVELLLTHHDSFDVQLRDFEIAFIPTGRKVRYLGEKVSA